MASTNYPQKVYRRPTNPFVGAGAKKLYALEEKRDATMKAAAEELGKVMGLTDFWREMLPEALHAVLEHWDHRAAELAAQTFLEGRGFVVTKNGKSPCRHGDDPDVCISCEMLAKKEEVSA